MRQFALIITLAALAACSKPTQTTEETQGSTAGQPPIATAPAADAVAPSAMASDEAAATGEERFYGKKSFTIVYKQTGNEVGDITEHVRDWGRKRVELKKTTTTMAGYSHAVNARTVFEGEKIVAVDLDTGAVSITNNPFYSQVVGRLNGKSGVEVGKEMMLAMGGKPTGESGTFVGQACDYWEVVQFGSRMCITKWGATLMMSAKMGPMTMDKVAQEVRDGDGGPDEAFAYDASKATTAPNLEEIMKKARGG